MHVQLAQGLNKVRRSRQHLHIQVFDYIAVLILSSVQLLVNKELFHQSSFYLIKILSSVQLLFKQHSFHQSRGNVQGGNALEPLRGDEKTTNDQTECSYFTSAVSILFEVWGVVNRVAEMFYSPANKISSFP